MDTYKIKDIKVGITNNGEMNGPFELPVNVAVQFICNGKTKWITNSEITGIPNFFITENDIFDKLNNINSMEEDSFQKELKSSCIESLDEIKLRDYDEINSTLSTSSNTNNINLIKLIVCLTRCNDKVTSNLITVAKNKNINEIDIDRYYNNL